MLIRSLASLETSDILTSRNLKRDCKTKKKVHKFFQLSRKAGSLNYVGLRIRVLGKNKH